MIGQRGSERAVLIGDLHLDVHVCVIALQNALALLDQLVIQSLLQLEVLRSTSHFSLYFVIFHLFYG